MSLQSKILDLADRCVKCGMCLPSCPTYQQTLNENESPRGRIALLQGLAAGQLQASRSLHQHLARCMNCRNCERICPAEVQYEQLLDHGRSLLAEKYPASRFARWLKHASLALLSRRERINRLNRLLRFYQRSGLQRLVRFSGLLRLTNTRHLESLLPPLKTARHYASRYLYIGEPQGRVALFSGCLGTTLEQDTLNATIILLNRLGFSVDIGKAQTCCGALARHNGEAQQAVTLARQNLASFASGNWNAIVYTASGCGAHLLNYPSLPWPDESLRQQAETFSRQTREITAFLSEIDWPETLKFTPLHKRVAVHEPCSQRNGLRQADLATPLLRRIPGLEVGSLPGNAQCCGGGGSYMLTQPVTAQRLRAEKLKAIEAAHPDIVVSTNPGCALYLAAGLPASNIRIVHPVVLLAEQLV